MANNEPKREAVSTDICLNYSDFLSSSCKKKWKFFDAIYGVLPIFGMVVRNSACTSTDCNQRFKELAMQVVSAQVSDEINIARLITLAVQQKITNFDIYLPYPLTVSQLKGIESEYGNPLKLIQYGDYLNIRTYQVNNP